MIFGICSLDGYAPSAIEEFKISAKTLLKMLLAHFNICVRGTGVKTM